MFGGTVWGVPSDRSTDDTGRDQFRAERAHGIARQLETDHTTTMPSHLSGYTHRRETMEQEPVTAETPPATDVLTALEDGDCRAILRALEEPRTASELTDCCDIPQSTLYRKLDLLSDASLVEERLEVRTDGRHSRRYALDFEAVSLSLTDDRRLEVDIDRGESSPEERLSTLWTEVREET